MARQHPKRRTRRSRRGPVLMTGLMSAPSIEDSSDRIRISRTIANPEVLGAIALALKKPHEEGVISKRSPYRSALTVFDTKQHPKPVYHEHTAQSLELLLHEQVPGLFDEVTVDVDGIEPFGTPYQPFIGLTFSGEELQREQSLVMSAIVPNIDLRSFAITSLRPHVSLAKTFSRRRAAQVQMAVQGFKPSKITFNPADIEVVLE